MRVKQARPRQVPAADSPVSDGLVTPDAVPVWKRPRRDSGEDWFRTSHSALPAAKPPLPTDAASPVTPCSSEGASEEEASVWVRVPVVEVVERAFFGLNYLPVPASVAAAVRAFGIEWRLWRDDGSRALLAMRAGGEHSADLELPCAVAEALWQMATAGCLACALAEENDGGGDDDDDDDGRRKPLLLLLMLHRARLVDDAVWTHRRRQELECLLGYFAPEASLATAPMDGAVATGRSVPERFRFEPDEPDTGHGDHDDGGELAWALAAVRRLPGATASIPVPARVPGLAPELRPYQRRAVAWMLERERTGVRLCGGLSVPVADVRGREHLPLTFDPFYGRLAESAADETSDSASNTLRGGILADEMGLGKTVEVLACVLLGGSAALADPATTLSPVASATRRGSWVCDECGAVIDHPHVSHTLHGAIGKRIRFCADCMQVLRSGQRLRGRGTLIVCPTPILMQWRAEIARHLVAYHLQVLFYRGIKHGQYLSARQLAAADLVLTTYEVLRADAHRDQQQLAHGRSLRHAKRYEFAPTPLSRVHWRRLCLDEAQLIEGGAAAAAALALRFEADTRWCVSGTPLRRSVDDLEALFRFLRFAPFDEPDAWRRVLLRPCERGGRGAASRLAQVLRVAAWRTEKRDVADEIGLPPQTETVRHIRLGPVERHFYQRQHEACAGAVRYLMTSRLAPYLDERGALLLRSSCRRGFRLIRHVLHHLTALRQACCHPKVGAAGLSSIQHNLMTMDQVLEVLLQRAQVECEEAQRSLVAAVNGLAAVAVLDGRVGEAVSLYREVLRRARESTSGVLEVDRLQRYHVLVNLAQLLAEHRDRRAEFGYTVRDEQLRAEAEALRRQYVAETTTRVEVLRAQLLELDAELAQLRHRQPTPAGSPWWTVALNWLVETGQEEMVLERAGVDAVHSAAGLAYWIHTAYQAMTEARAALTGRLLTLPGSGERPPTADEVQESGACGKCREDMHGRECQHCRAESLFEAYERRLFSVRTRRVNRTQQHRDDDDDDGGGDGGDDAKLEAPTRRRLGVVTEYDGGVRLMSELERVLRLVHGQSRRGMLSAAASSASLEWQIWALCKREFTLAHAYFRAQKDALAALDELDMAATRITYRPATSLMPLSERERRYRILPVELPAVRARLEADRQAAEELWQRRLGQWNYLRQLHRADGGSGGDGGGGTCPICYHPTGDELVLLPCGHRFCVECTSHYLQSRVVKHHSTLLPCPVCRERYNIREVSYITRTDDDGRASAAAPIRGNYGAKVEAVVQDLLQLQQQQPQSPASAPLKCVVFSQWKAMLLIVAHALQENRMRYFHGAVEPFRACTDAFAVLLLSTRTGANGLNLIEATHVFLLEPLLSPGTELQAISRVHRIGQTHPTYVHRYVVRDTIEEQVHALGCHRRDAQAALGSKSGSDMEELTLADLRAMFATKEQGHESVR